MVAATNYYKRVSKRVYPGAVSMAQAHKTIFKVGLPAAVLAMLAPFGGGYQDHYGLAFLTEPILGPVAAALILTVFPFRPYRGAPFAWGGFRKLKADNPEDASLISIFHSSEIFRFLWVSALKIVLILGCVMSAITLVFRHSLNWTFPGSMMGVIGPLLASYLILSSRVMDYGFTAYAKTEDSSRK